MDLNNDGFDEIITGSYHEQDGPGYLYIFRRIENGGLTNWQYLRNRAGEQICFEDRNEHGERNTERSSNSYSLVPHTTDWDGDGDLDLLVGHIGGRIFYLENEGSANEPLFATHYSELLGRYADGCCSGPTTADWDGDGDLDLFVGYGGSGVHMFENIGTSTSPKLADESVVLIHAAPRDHDPKESAGGKPPRLKVFVTDYNGDGALDLLVGSYSMKRTPFEMTEEREAEMKVYKAASDLVQAKIKAIETEHDAAGFRAKSDYWTGQADWLRSLPYEVRQEYQELSDASEGYSELMSPYWRKERYSFHGYVWVYLRNPSYSQAASK